MKPNPVTLFVDSQKDFEIVKPMLESMLEQPDIVHCKSHHEAMEYIHSDQYADIIFADWSLTGYRFMDSVRHDPENHNTPVIIMSEDTTIQNIVLNNIDREATYFLAKPFLEKGLVMKFDQVLQGLERRRKFRIRPDSEVILPVRFNDNLELDLHLVNLSLDGCLFRVPVDTAHEIRIFEQARVSIVIDEFDLEVRGEVYRIGPDFGYPGMKETVLVMVMFDASEQEARDVLELVDDLGKRW